MKYALTTFALIITLVGGFVFGAYYMYNKYNPKAQETVATEDVAEPEVDETAYYDSEGNWIFKYNEDESGYGGQSTTVSAGGKASENIDYRITGTNFVYEDDGYFSGFHAVVSVENIGSSNLYLGKDSVFNIEDRNLEVVDSYDYVRAVPDVIAPGEKGFFYVPYGQIKTIEDSVTINENALSGDVLDATSEDTQEGSVESDDENNAVDIEELEKALGIDREGSEDEGESAAEDNSASIKKVNAEVLMAEADDAKSGKVEADGTSDDASKKEEEGSKEESDQDPKESGTEASEDEPAADSGESGDTESTEDGSEDPENPETEADIMEETESAVEYPGLSLYKVNEYFIMPVLDVQKCADDPRSDYSIDNIVYGSNASGYFTLSADVTNNTEGNVDYIPVTVVALDRRGNAIAVGRDALTDFYSGAKMSFGVSYILTREQRSNIVQCVIYARESVSK